jgi:hypothetical protein
MSNSADVHISMISWPPEGLTVEILRLFILYPHQDEQFKAMGMGPEEMAARQFVGLDEPGGTVLAAWAGRRLRGLVNLVPEIWPSAFLNRHIWSIRQLIIAQDAPKETAEELVRSVPDVLNEPVEFLSARVPAMDRVTIRGLRGAGFRTVQEQAIAVIECPAGTAEQIPSVRFVPMEAGHLKAVAAISRDCWRYGHYTLEPDFDAESVGELQNILLSGYLHEPGGGALVAENESGEVLGFVAYTQEKDTLAVSRRRPAKLDMMGIRADMRAGGKLAKLLNRHALVALKNRGVDTVTFRIATANQSAMRTLEMLKKIGYRIASTDLIMHRSLIRAASEEMEPWMRGTKQPPASRHAY